MQWEAYACSTCGSLVTGQGSPASPGYNGEVVQLFPEPKTAHEDVPEPARTFLQQAFESLHAPDAAAMVAGSSVDAMLKALKYKKGSLYERIDQARADGVLKGDGRLGS